MDKKLEARITRLERLVSRNIKNENGFVRPGTEHKNPEGEALYEESREAIDACNDFIDKIDKLLKHLEHYNGEVRKTDDDLMLKDIIGNVERASGVTTDVLYYLDNASQWIDEILR